MKESAELYCCPFKEKKRLDFLLRGKEPPHCAVGFRISSEQTTTHNGSLVITLRVDFYWELSGLRPESERFRDVRYRIHEIGISWHLTNACGAKFHVTPFAPVEVGID